MKVKSCTGLAGFANETQSLKAKATASLLPLSSSSIAIPPAADAVLSSFSDEKIHCL